MNPRTLYTLNGETLSLIDWASRLGYTDPIRGSSTLRKRIVVLGWPVELALTTPPRRWVSADDAFAAGKLLKTHRGISTP